jgi:hypothetical protein
LSFRHGITWRRCDRRNKMKGEDYAFSRLWATTLVA